MIPRATPARAFLAAAFVSLAFVSLALATAASAQSSFLFAVTTDFSIAGNCATIDLAAPWTPHTGLQAVSSDPVVRWFNGKLYVVNRLGADNIQVLDPAQGFGTVIEFSVGAGTNPQDIMVLTPTKAYVTRYESALLLIVNPSTGASVGTIDLSGFADSDGLPEMAYMALDGRYLFVALQRLSRPAYTPVPPSMIAVIDTQTDTVVDVNPSLPGIQAIALTGTNPSGEMQMDTASHTLYVSETGVFGVEDGGIEAVNTRTFSALGFLTTEAQLGGDVGPCAILPGKGYAVVSDNAFFTNNLVRFAIPGGANTGTLYTTDGYCSDLEYDAPTSQLFLCDRLLTSPGVQIFSTTSDTRLTSSAISTGLPPFDLCVARPTRTDVASVTGPALRAWAEPNPFRGTTEIHCEGDARAGNQDAPAIDLFDINGRCVRHLAGAGGGALQWDGRDGSGRMVSPGVYYFRVVGAAASASGRVVLVR